MFKMRFITLKAHFKSLVIDFKHHLYIGCVSRTNLCVAHEVYDNLRDSGCMYIIGGKEDDALHPTILISVNRLDQILSAFCW
jgi:hypothetical protein